MMKECGPKYINNTCVTCRLYGQHLRMQSRAFTAPTVSCPSILLPAALSDDDIHGRHERHSLSQKTLLCLFQTLDITFVSENSPGLTLSVCMQRTKSFVTACITARA